MRRVILAAGAALGVATAAAAAPPPAGVYACYGQSGPAIPMMFGLLDGRSYAVYDGKTGHYRYEEASGTLNMTDGPLAGIKYRRLDSSGRPTTANAFRMLDSHGGVTAYMCPKDGNKDPRKHPW